MCGTILAAAVASAALGGSEAAETTVPCATTSFGVRPVTPEALETLKHSLIHRGDGVGRPDNTMEAMLYTWGKGYAPECDIRYTRDKKEKAR